MASQKLSRRSFGSKLNFVVSILYFYMDFHGFPLISIDFNTKLDWAGLDGKGRDWTGLDGTGRD